MKAKKKNLYRAFELTSRSWCISTLCQGSCKGARGIVGVCSGILTLCDVPTKHKNGSKWRFSSTATFLDQDGADRCQNEDFRFNNSRHESEAPSAIKRLYNKQECCIPVGCGPPASVAVSWGGGVYPGGVGWLVDTPWTDTPPADTLLPHCILGHTHPPPWIEGMTHACLHVFFMRKQSQRKDIIVPLDRYLWLPPANGSLWRLCFHRCLFVHRRGVCQGGSLLGGVSVRWGLYRMGSLSNGGGLYWVGSLSSRRGSLSRWEVSVQVRGLCPGGFGFSVQVGDLCPGGGGSLSRLEGGCLSRGVSVRETPPYGYVRTVRILLECILVNLFVQYFHHMRH